MTEYLKVHPVNPERRLMRHAGRVLMDGGLIVYPTDSCYAFGWRMGSTDALRQIERVRHTGKSHNFTVVCRDLSEIASYAKVENWAYRLLRAHTPGAYTFILKATRDVPRRLQNPRQRSIGIRVPDHPVPMALLDELQEPLMSSTLILADEEGPLTDPAEILHRLQGEVALVIDGGICGFEPTTVVDLTKGYAEILRQGKGPVDDFA